MTVTAPPTTELSDRRPSRTVAATAVAVATGGAWAAAHPGPAVWWLVLLVVPGWLTAVQLVADRRPRAAFGVGWLLAVVAFVPLLRWLALPATWIAPVLLAAAVGVYVGLASVAVRPWVRSRAVVVVGPVLWAGMEVVRARWPLSGFGWADLATAHTDASWMLTAARVVGGDGLTLLTALLGGFAFATLRELRGAWSAAVEDRPGAIVPGAAQAAGTVDRVRPLLLGTIGVAVLGTLVTAEPPPVVGELDVLVVQGNDGSNLLTGSAEDLRLAEAHRVETERAVAEGGRPDLTVWGENALDRDPWTPSGADLLPSLQRATAVAGPAIVGVIRDGDDPSTFRNSMVLVDERGGAVSAYDKIDVVPFGEYVPWRSVLGDLGPLTRVPRDAIPGTGPVTHVLDGVRIATVICFETLFPGTFRRAVLDDEAGLVVAATNDSSYGRSVMSDQHVNQSRLRAVETGRAVVHASIAGSSAIILPDGSIVATTPLYEVASIRATVPVVEGHTPAAVVGPVVSGALGVAFVVGLLVAALRPVLRRRSREAVA